jgi:hypothetical protein
MRERLAISISVASLSLAAILAHQLSPAGEKFPHRDLQRVEFRRACVK